MSCVDVSCVCIVRANNRIRDKPELMTLQVVIKVPRVPSGLKSVPFLPSVKKTHTQIGMYCGGTHTYCICIDKKKILQNHFTKCLIQEQRGLLNVCRCEKTHEYPSQQNITANMHRLRDIKRHSHTQKTADFESCPMCVKLFPHESRLNAVLAFRQIWSFWWTDPGASAAQTSEKCVTSWRAWLSPFTSAHRACRQVR